jgi:hypothetical protein
LEIIVSFLSINQIAPNNPVDGHEASRQAQPNNNFATNHERSLKITPSLLPIAQIVRNNPQDGHEA